VNDVLVTPTSTVAQRARSAAALASLVGAASLGTLAGLKWGPGTWWGQGIYFACKAVLLIVPTAWLFRIDRSRAGWSPARSGSIGVGVLLGFITAAAILSGYALAATAGWIDGGPLRTLAAKNHLNTFWIYLAFATGTSLGNALLEEYVWRWFVVRRWEDLLGPTLPWRRTLAVFLAAACFTAHHTVVLSLYFAWPAVALGSAGVFIGGTLWSALYMKYRSIWPGYACHILADIAIFIVGWHLIAGAP
jgi:membrane protease YdiL (CAAX protease family)